MAQVEFHDGFFFVLVRGIAQHAFKLREAAQAAADIINWEKANA